MQRPSLAYDRVDELFDNAVDRDQHLRRCAVTGSTFTRDDRLKPIKDKARRVLAAADWFDQNGPLDYRLPLNGLLPVRWILRRGFSCKRRPVVQRRKFSREF